MKYLITVAWLFLAVVSGSAQGEDIQVFERKEGNKVIVVARNVGKVAYEVTVAIEAKGMKVTPGLQVSAVIPAGYMKDMATLEPIPGQGWSYGYEVSFMESSGTPPSDPVREESPATTSDAAAPVTSQASPPASLSTAPLVIYTQAGCGRCAMVRRELTSRGVQFEEVDVNSGSPEVNAMWMKLRENGFKGNSVTMPVVRYQGSYHYDIKDLRGFVDSIK